MQAFSVTVSPPASTAKILNLKGRTEETVESGKQDPVIGEEAKMPLTQTEAA